MSPKYLTFPLPFTALFSHLFPVLGKNMAPNQGYLTFSPSTSSSRSILQEPSERRQEPSERRQKPSERSQEPLERSLAQENSKWQEATIERVVELARNKPEWDKIGEAVSLPPNTCRKIWRDWKRLCKQVIRRPKAKRSRHRKYWTGFEDKTLLNLWLNGYTWDEISAEIHGRSAGSCRMRHKHLIDAKARIQPMTHGNR